VDSAAVASFYRSVVVALVRETITGLRHYGKIKKVNATNRWELHCQSKSPTSWSRYIENSNPPKGDYECRRLAIQYLISV